MRVSIFIFFCFLTLLQTPDIVLSDDLCETGWLPYKNNKCLKLFPKTSNDEESFCKEQNASPILNNSEEKQIIAATFFKSQNDKNVILCEKNQLWSLTKLQDELLKIQEKVDNLIPVGFIYVQLPKEQSPLELWPTFTWADVSSDYDGVFFRTIGKDSAAFGEVQQAGAPRIVTVKGYSAKNSTDIHTTITIEPNDELSGIVWTAYEGNPAYYFYRGLQFQQSADEVRPRNMAVRVWQRTL